MRRTKPYGYALFNLDAMATISGFFSSAQQISTFELADGARDPEGDSVLAPSSGTKRVGRFNL